MKNNDLTETRLKLGLTQKECAKILNMSLRNYVRYEDEEHKTKSFKYDQMIYQLKNSKIIDENHGILKFDYVKKCIRRIAKSYDIDFIYIYNDYAKKEIKENSSIDLLISSSSSLFLLENELKNKLNKKINIIDFSDYINNKDIIKIVLKEGIKIL